MTQLVSYTVRALTFCALASGALLCFAYYQRAIFAYYQRAILHFDSIWTPSYSKSEVRAAWSMLVGPRAIRGANARRISELCDVCACSVNARLVIHSVSIADSRWWPRRRDGTRVAESL